MTKPKEQITVFSFGAIAYSMIELLWRNHTHWSMSLTGGACFSILYNLYQYFQKLPILGKCTLGSIVITSVEFLVGMIVNVWKKWNVWDYSHLRFNFLGQICLLYSVLWFFLSFPIVLVSNQLKRYLKKPLRV